MEDEELLGCPLPEDAGSGWSDAGDSLLDSEGEAGGEEDDLRLSSPTVSRGPSPEETNSSTEQEAVSLPVCSPQWSPSSPQPPPPESHCQLSLAPPSTKTSCEKTRIIRLDGKRKFRCVPDALPDLPLPKLAVSKKRPVMTRARRITRPSLLLEPKRLRICEPNSDFRNAIVACRVARLNMGMAGGSVEGAPYSGHGGGKGPGSGLADAGSECLQQLRSIRDSLAVVKTGLIYSEPQQPPCPPTGPSPALWAPRSARTSHTAPSSSFVLAQTAASASRFPRKIAVAASDILSTQSQKRSVSAFPPSTATSPAETSSSLQPASTAGHFTGWQTFPTAACCLAATTLPSSPLFSFSPSPTPQQHPPSLFRKTPAFSLPARHSSPSPLTLPTSQSPARHSSPSPLTLPTSQSPSPSPATPLKDAGLPSSINPFYAKIQETPQQSSSLLTATDEAVNPFFSALQDDIVINPVDSLKNTMDDFAGHIATPYDGRVHPLSVDSVNPFTSTLYDGGANQQCQQLTPCHSPPSPFSFSLTRITS